MTRDFWGGEVLEELVSRTKHGDPYVRQIARALLGNVEKGSNGWVRRVMSLPEMNTYNSPFEKALVLEKIMLHYILYEFWESVIHLGKVQRGELAKVKSRINELDQPEWDKVAEQITDDIYLRVAGRPIQTHRLKRYESLIEKIVVPLLGKNGSEIVVADAGSSSGAGSQVARMQGLPLKKWVAVDMCDPKENLSCVLTCSIRLGEILDGRFRKIIKNMFNWPVEFQFVKGDIENLPRKLLTGFADVYLAVFSYYQLKNPKRAFGQALKVVKTGGIILLTDYFLPGKLTPESVITPGRGGLLTTGVWRSNGAGRAELITSYLWADTDLSKFI